MAKVFVVALHLKQTGSLRMKRSIFIATALGISIESVHAYSSPTMQQLDNDDLRMVVGQSASMAVMADPYNIYLDQIRHKIQQLMQPDKMSSAGMDNFRQVFQVNEKGEMWMNIQRNTIAIGTIEFAMSFDGLKQLGDAVMNEIKFY